MAYKLTHARVDALANGFIFASACSVVYLVWTGDPGADELVRFVLSTASSWLTFLTACVAAMIVFIAVLYTVQDPLFWKHFSRPVNYERKAYVAVLLLSVACLSLVTSSQNPPTHARAQAALAAAGMMAGVLGLIKVYFVFLAFYSVNYSELKRQQLLLEERPVVGIRKRIQERRAAHTRRGGNG